MLFPKLGIYLKLDMLPCFIFFNALIFLYYSEIFIKTMLYLFRNNQHSTNIYVYITKMYLIIVYTYIIGVVHI